MKVEQFVDKILENRRLEPFEIYAMVLGTTLDKGFDRGSRLLLEDSGSAISGLIEDAHIVEFNIVYIHTVRELFGDKLITTGISISDLYNAVIDREVKLKRTANIDAACTRAKIHALRSFKHALYFCLHRDGVLSEQDVLKIKSAVATKMLKVINDNPKSIPVFSTPDTIVFAGERPNVAASDMCTGRTGLSCILSSTSYIAIKKIVDNYKYKRIKFNNVSNDKLVTNVVVRLQYVIDK